MSWTEAASIEGNLSNFKVQTLTPSHEPANMQFTQGWAGHRVGEIVHG
jgi:hypothetical protein